MRLSIRALSVGLTLLAAAACSDVPTTTAPGRSLAPATNRGPSFDYSGGGAFAFGDSKTSFVVGPRGGSYLIGGLFTVYFPAGSICDPAISSYGEGTWDTPCVTLTGPLKVTATVHLENGDLAVDFQPAMRFSPSKSVIIATDLFAPTIIANRAYFEENSSSLAPLAVLYAPTLGARPVADFETDSSLTTHVDLNTGRVWRRVKHFSGYMMGTGEACTPSPDNPDCVWVDTDG